MSNLHLIMHLAREELIERHSGSLLGRTWTVISPIIQIMIFILVFSKIMGAKLEGFGAEIDQYSYSIYLVCGILPWMAFSKSIERISNLFDEKRGLISKINLSLKALPCSVLVAETVIFLIGMFFFMLFLLWIDFQPALTWLLVLPLFLLQLVIAYGLGLFLAVLAVYLKDVKETIAIGLQLGFWCTPIVYVLEILPQWAVEWMQLNPVFVLINTYRDCLLYKQLPNSGDLLSLLFLAVMLLALSAWLLKKTERDLRDML
jgi:lipopolysaccharide transport system permease protein